MASERIQRQIDRLLDEAETAFAQRDWSGLQERSQDALALDPENGDALTFLAAAQTGLATSAADAPAAPPTPPPQAESTSQPASFADGRYQVKRFLGVGDKKKVYLAHDTTLDREVAFALIKTEGLDETSRTRVQREAQAMGRLGSHSHIVTVFDLGEEQGQPYMVTGLMGGGDVEGVIEDADGHRLPLEQAIKIAQETCRGMVSRRYSLNLQMGLGHEGFDPELNAWASDFKVSESNHRSFYRRWGQLMAAESWTDLQEPISG